MSRFQLLRPALRQLITRFAAVIIAVLMPTIVSAQAPSPSPQGGALPEFTVLVFERPADLARRTDARLADAYWTAYDEFAAFLMKAGALRGGSALSETVRETVRGSGGVDGAVAGARLGGYFVIAAADLAAARALAAKAPAFALLVEVRPHRANPHMAKMRVPPTRTP